ncbi:MAG: cobalamin-binding protein [Chitinophagaceae bacterium]
MPVFVDQLNRSISVTTEPKRIISLVPSQTELLFHLGLDKEVIGITKFCIHPEDWFRTKERIGGTKQLNIDKIKSLKPDLIIANKEENVQVQIELLANEFPVWISDVNNLGDALTMIESVGEMVNKSEQAQKIKNEIQHHFHELKMSGSKPKACYLIWREPYMTVGGDTFISNMLEYAGFENMFSNKERYPEVTIDELKSIDCEWLLLSSEPFPFVQKHIEELQPLLPNTKIVLVDGEYFSWYGSRLINAPDYFMQLRQQIPLNV